MYWTFLFLAGLCEIGWAVGLKYTDGFSRLMPSILVIAVSIASMALLSLAVTKLPIGTAYAVWTGIGVIGTFVFGILLFQEPISVSRFVFVAMILSGILGLRFIS